jgi:hypothetical protein
MPVGRESHSGAKRRGEDACDVSSTMLGIYEWFLNPQYHGWGTGSPIGTTFWACIGRRSGYRISATATREAAVATKTPPAAIDSTSW